MTKVRIEGAGEFYQHYPRVPMILTSHSGGKDNAMAVAWHTPIRTTPPLYGVTLNLKRYSRELILESGKFGVNFLPWEKAQLIARVGGISGWEADKFEKFKIVKDESVNASVPILKDAYAAYECKVVDHKIYEPIEWFVGQIVATYFNEEAFTKEQLLDLGKVNLALYFGADVYGTISKESVQHIDRKS